MKKIESRVAVIATCETLFAKAKKLATQLRLPLVSYEKIPTNFYFLLTVTSDRIELIENNNKKSKPVFVDFLSSKLKYRIKHGGGKNQLIAKAIGIKNKKNPFVIDATAGLGVDAFILSSLGCEVLMLERSPIIGALLEDGLKRLKKDPEFSHLKMRLKIVDSTDYITKLIQKKSKKPDVIYLDPMYPKRVKSALNKKEMRVLHEIVGNDADGSNLLNISLKCARNRVVVKRPKLANSLGSHKPDLKFLSSGSGRYDVYFSDNLA